MIIPLNFNQSRHVRLEYLITKKASNEAHKDYWLTVTLGSPLRARDSNPDHRQVVEEFPRKGFQVGLADVFGVDVVFVAALKHRVAEVERRVADEVASQVDANADAAVRVCVKKEKSP